MLHSVHMALAGFTVAAPLLGRGLATCRTLHLLDIENLMGGPDFTVEEVARLADEYGPIADLRSDDMTVLASSHYAAFAAWFGWPRARRLLRSGQDGADLALIDVMLSEDVAHRFDRVVVASGDGIFSSPCAWLQEMDCSVTVVCRPTALSRRLALAVRDVRFLRTEPEGAPNIAVLRRAA